MEFGVRAQFVGTEWARNGHGMGTEWVQNGYGADKLISRLGEPN